VYGIAVKSEPAMNGGGDIGVIKFICRPPIGIAAVDPQNLMHIFGFG
jgi:hypothetical protein